MRQICMVAITKIEFTHRLSQLPRKVLHWFNHRNNALFTFRLHQKVNQYVITSYSIHYTKLYEHDTISRVLAAINPDEFSKCFTDWIDCLRESVDNEVIAIDGKTICNSKDKSKGLSAVHIVSAYAAQNHLCLGQLATNSKSNEITAIPKLLKLLNVKGATITIDAMGCQREIAKEVIAAEANYLLAVKGNQPTLEQNIDDTIRFAKPIDSSESVDCGHGRVEKRHCTVYNNLEHIEHANQWSALKSIVVVNTERYTKATKKTEYQTRYYISNQIRTAKEFNKSVRSHWAIRITSYNVCYTKLLRGVSFSFSFCSYTAFTRSKSLGFNEISFPHAVSIGEISCAAACNSGDVSGPSRLKNMLETRLSNRPDSSMATMVLSKDGACALFSMAAISVRASSIATLMAVV